MVCEVRVGNVVYFSIWAHAVTIVAALVFWHTSSRSLYVALPVCSSKWEAATEHADSKSVLAAVSRTKEWASSDTLVWVAWNERATRKVVVTFPDGRKSIVLYKGDVIVGVCRRAFPA